VAETERIESGPEEAQTARGASTRIELERRAQAAARRVAEAKATIPHLYLSRVLPLPRAVEGDALLGLIVRAAAVALREHPRLNGAWRDGAVEERERINVGFTVELPEGPLTPTLFDADGRDPAELALAVAELRGQAEAGALASPALAGATFTVSAVEAGADAFAPVIVSGQAAHLGVGRPRRAPIAGSDGTVSSADVVALTLACDGRVVRPPQAADFLERLAAAAGEG
jgi:pyruvate dehydrogenase E2 component (dihydrolipoamide acetyltransferase)